MYLDKGVGDNREWGGEDDDIIPNKYAIDNDLQGRYLDTFFHFFTPLPYFLHNYQLLNKSFHLLSGLLQHYFSYLLC